MISKGSDDSNLFVITDVAVDDDGHRVWSALDNAWRAGEYDRSSGEGIYFALIEWLLLARSSLILNTYGSSFAVEAAAVNVST